MRRSSTRRLAVLVSSGVVLCGCAVAFAAEEEVLPGSGSERAVRVSQPTEASTPSELTIREDVSRATPVQLLVARLEPATDATPASAVKVDQDGARWRVAARTDVRVVRVTSAPLVHGTVVRTRLNEASGPRFAQISRTAGADHGTLGLLTLDGALLMSLKAPQPLTNGFLELPPFRDPSGAVDFVNRITKSRP